jgi:hypothetical protein
MSPHDLLRGQLYFYYVDDVRTSKETRVGHPRIVTGPILITYVLHVLA